ncbi:MAG: FKBP-type peptidyl-prolyl cis-trans isomerase [Gammaproteobacteria bacterium]|nr:FKBP-type peptidyl-prolyl cis-trans isomerase [Gammaproteobacteria bacterium]
MIKYVRFVSLAVVLSISLAALSGCSDSSGPAPVMAGVTELVVTNVVEGNGAEAVSGNTVSVHYTGWIYDEMTDDKKGVKFDSSRDRGQPFGFPLGAGRVIKGWDQCVEGMRVGGQRILTIPPELAYGSRGAGRVIPANATLIFDVELLAVE